jgi:hypothetical protein
VRDLSGSKVAKGNGKGETSLPSFWIALMINVEWKDIKEEHRYLLVDECSWTPRTDVIRLSGINGDASKPGNISSRILPRSNPVWGVVSEQGNPIVPNQAT